MRVPTLRRHHASATGVSGTARTGRRTTDLLRRLRPGDVAVIDHVDLDKATAQSLVAARVVAVVNAAQSMSGRYPNLGPDVLLRAGVVVVDGVGADVFARIEDGDRLRVDGDTVFRDSAEVATGDALTAERLAVLTDAARAGLATQLEAFAVNTTEHLRRERDLLLDGSGVPDVDARLAGRPVVVVTRAHDCVADLRGLRRYLRDARPVLLGVEDGADLLLATGHTPDLIVGGLGQVSDRALRCGAELVVHTARDGYAPGLERVQRLGLRYTTFAVTGTHEDAALLLAGAHDPAVIVTVGSHASLLDFLDHGRAGMASTFLTRLKLGGRIVDAKAVPRLHTGGIRGWQLVLLVLLALAVVAVAIAATPVGQHWADLLQARWGSAIGWLRGAVP